MNERNPLTLPEGDEGLLLRLMAFLGRWTDEDYRSVFHKVFRGSFEEYSTPYEKLLSQWGAEGENGVRALSPEQCAEILAAPGFSAEGDRSFFRAALETYSEADLSDPERAQYCAGRLLALIEDRAETPEQLFACLDALQERVGVRLTGEAPESVCSLYAALTDRAEKLCGKGSDPWLICADRQAKELAEAGSYEEAEKLQSEVCSVCADMGGGELSRAFRRSLALYRQRLGLYAEAAALFDELYKEAKTDRGESDEETAFYAQAFADVCADGEADADTMRLAVRRLTETLGSDHPGTLEALEELGRACERAGDSAGAESVFRQLLELRKKAEGPRSESVLRTHVALAGVYNAMKEYTGALEHAEYAHDLLAMLKGENDPDTLSALAEMATAVGESGDREQELQLRRTAADGFEATLGKADPLTLYALHRLAETQYKAKKYEDAMETLHRIHQQQSEDEAVGTRLEILDCMQKLGDHDALIAEGRNLLWKLEEMDPEPVREKEILLNLLSVSGYTQKLWEAASNWDKKRRELFRRLYGPNSPEAIGAAFDAAMDYALWGVDDKAIVYAAEAYALAKDAMGEEEVLTRKCAALLDELNKRKEN